MKTRHRKHLINVVTLGCSKNVVDSESLMKQLDANGLKVVHDKDDSGAETVIINTCGFIKDAKEESVNTILRYVRAKEDGLLNRVYVMGCLSERYKPELEKEIPDVDKYFGSNNLQDIIESLGYNYRDNLAGERLTTTPTHYAYLKISEGCDRQCSFCAIPLMRGKHRSKPQEEILKEARGLVHSGARELILIAQDLTYYGIDTHRKQLLATVLEELAAIDNLEWIRLHYAYPANFPKEVLKVMRRYGNICNYLDIPFQHISDPVLKKMRRGVTSAQTYALIDRFRQEVPGLTLRTTLMTGHPGEGEREFEDLLRFVEKVGFDRLGVFTYSEEEDTFGARNFADTIPESVKQQRADRVMDLQRSISLAKNTEKIGQTVRVLIDRREGHYYIGRTEGDSPEVDNEVLVATKNTLEPGAFYPVKITEAREFDLIGIITDTKSNTTIPESLMPAEIKT
jgi:ribosomal protein S12 methylthiotransferase